MADIVYTVNQDSPESILGFEQYSEQDKALVSSFQVNSVFDPSKNYSELHILSLSDELLESTYDYTGFKQLGNAQSAGQEGASVVTIDPIEDSKLFGYVNGGVKLLYHFLDDLYTQDRSVVDFYIQDISPDRKEVSLATKTITSEDLVTLTNTIKENLQSQSYFTGFRLNFKSNDLFIATNIDTLDSPTGKVVVVKLYEPLPTTYAIKSILNIVDIVSDSVAYEVDSEYIIPPTVAPTLRSPNFNIEITDNSVIPTSYLNYDELLSYPINNSNSQIFSAINELGAEISVDYSQFSNFVHFSSAQERLLNFKYKIDLINTYSASLSSISAATTGLQGISGSKYYYQDLLTGVVSNFDHYERFLYYESGSNSWPKSNNTTPYINKQSSSPEAITWYTGQITNAIQYDQTNYSSLVYSIPTFLRDDANNENYLTFVYMVGQHFDNLWLYSKAVTDKYDADNRVDHGISKDLVGEALRNFGVKLYTSNKSVEDLFTTFIGQAYQSGSEKINHYITGSLTGSNTPIQPTSYDNYQKEVQKRIYHNLPLLLKSKGTERGLRALINCLGIQGDLLDIKYYGGRNTTERPFFGDYQPYTSSLNKIRLDNTGSIVTGSTLSSNTSIIKRDGKYTDDLHVLEVGFSHVDNIDTYIRANITASFDIDDYIGDPQGQYEHTYSDLNAIARTTLSGSLGTSGSYDLRDYVRLIKFYDNTIFKMVKDFIPARTLADTGIIIKPNLLNRSKTRAIIASGSRPEYTGSIDTSFTQGGNAGIFKGIENGVEVEYNTAYDDKISTPTGPVEVSTFHGQQQPRFNGEFQGSGLTVTNGNLTSNNTYLLDTNASHYYDITFVTSSGEVCLLNPISNIQYITSATTQYYLSNFFTQAGQCLFELTSPTTQPITFPIAFGDITPPLQQYDTVTIHATNPNYTGIGTCEDVVTFTYGVCNLSKKVTAPNTVIKYQPGGSAEDTYNIESWFDYGPADNATLQYTASWNDGTQYTVGIVRGAGVGQSQQYTFTQAADLNITITVKDPRLGEQCNLSTSVLINLTGLSALPTGSLHGNEFNYTKDQATPSIDQSIDTPPTDPEASGGLTGAGNVVINPEIPYECIRSNSYIGPRGTPYQYIDTAGGTFTKYRTLGVPGYFAPLNDPGHTVGIGPRTRYTAYKLTCNNANERTTANWRGNWHIQVVDGFDTVSPYNIDDAHTQWLGLDTSLSSIGSFLKAGEKQYTQPVLGTTEDGPYYPFYDTPLPSIDNPTPLNTSQAPFALTFPTQEDSVCLCYTPTFGPQECNVVEYKTYLLDRAYIVRAFDVDSPNIFVQTTVYGKAGRLAKIQDGETLPLEGASQYTVPGTLGVQSLTAKFIDLWLLAGWDYSQGHPTLLDYGQQDIYHEPPDTTSYPTPNTPGTSVGPWIKVPVRYFYNPDSSTAFPNFPSEKAAIQYVIGQDWENPPGFI